MREGSQHHAGDGHGCEGPNERRLGDGAAVAGCFDVSTEDQRPGPEFTSIVLVVVLSATFPYLVSCFRGERRLGVPESEKQDTNICLRKELLREKICPRVRYLPSL